MEIQTNKIVYVGSSENAKKRWTEHKTKTKYYIKNFDSSRAELWRYYIDCQQIHAYMGDKGIDNFEFVILENNIDSKMKAFVEECYYINKLQPSQNGWINNRNGYIGYRMPISVTKDFINNQSDFECICAMKT